MKYLWLAQLVPFAILLYLYFQNRSMKKRQDALANDLQGQRYWRINLGGFKSEVQHLPPE